MRLLQIGLILSAVFANAQTKPRAEQIRNWNQVRWQQRFAQAFPGFTFYGPPAAATGLRLDQIRAFTYAGETFVGQVGPCTPRPELVACVVSTPGAGDIPWRLEVITLKDPAAPPPASGDPQGMVIFVRFPPCSNDLTGNCQDPGDGTATKTDVAVVPTQ